MIDLSDGFVSDLRGITEEGDLNTILKTTIGGFTKKSVQEYLSFVKSQQQGLKEEYLKELSRIQAEKEALERDMDEALTRIKSDEAKICRYETNGAMLNTANDKIDELNAFIKMQDDELKALRKSESELRNSLAELNSSQSAERYDELLVCNEQLKKEIAIRDQKLENSEKACRTLEGQLKISRELQESLSAELELIRGQNEWLESENKTLTDKLEAEFEKSLEQCREIARFRAELAILNRRYDSLELKMSPDRGVL